MATLQTTSLKMRAVIRLTELVIFLGIVYFCVRAVLGFLAPQSLWTPVIQNTQIAAAQTSAQSAAQFDFSTDPFHRDIAPNEVSVGQDAPETSLSLKLYGRRAGATGSAIIETPDRVQGVFNIGDEIIDGVTLKAVNPEYVVLSRRGTLERLTFERDGESLFGTNVPDAPVNNAGSKTSGRSGAASPQMTDQMSSRSETSLAQMSPQDLISALSFTRVMERGKSGSVKGFEVTSTSDKINLEAFGLRSGDIITSIGGQDLTKGRPEIGAIISQLSASNSVRLNVLRGETNLVLNVGRP